MIRPLIAKNSLNPLFYEKTKDGEQMYDISSRLVKDRRIFLNCEIDDDVASTIVSLIYLLDKENKKEKINIWINSPGGCLEGLLAIYDIMNYVEAPICTVCMSQAASAAAVILAAGTPGMRYVMPNSEVMIHQIQTGFDGSTPQIETKTKELKRRQNVLNEILARHTGQTIAKIKRDTTNDKFMTAQEAVDYGLADNIWQPKKKIPELKGPKK